MCYLEFYRIPLDTEDASSVATSSMNAEMYPAFRLGAYDNVDLQIPILFVCKENDKGLFTLSFQGTDQRTKIVSGQST
jgi:hypothetical protein